MKKNVQAVKNVTALASSLAYENPNKQIIPFWTRNQKYSTSQALVFIDSENSKVVVAFPGTSVSNRADLSIDARIAVGKQISNEKRFNRNKQLVQNIINEYGKDNVTVTGHSLGGREAIYIGKELDIPSVTYNLGTSPLDIVNNVYEDVKKNPDAYKKATIYVNPFDLISTSSQLIPGATIKSSGLKEEGSKLLYDMGMTALGGKALKPFSHLQIPGAGLINGLSAGLTYADKLLGYHQLNQYLPQQYKSSGGSTLKSSLNVTTYANPKKQDYSFTTSTMPQRTDTRFEPLFAGNRVQAVIK